MADRAVFVVDDNKEFRAGYQVQGFEESEIALDRFAEMDKTTPCCVLLDIRMPTMSGMNAHDAMHERSIDVPVVYIMTGHGDDVPTKRWKLLQTPLVREICFLIKRATNRSTIERLDIGIVGDLL